jgi:hypothetical protein
MHLIRQHGDRWCTSSTLKMPANALGKSVILHATSNIALSMLYVHTQLRCHMCCYMPVMHGDTVASIWVSISCCWLAHLEQVLPCCLRPLQLSFTQECPDGLLCVIGVHRHVIPAMCIWVLGLNMLV